MATATWQECKEQGDGKEADIPRPARYRTCPAEGEAVRLTRSNRPEVAAWVRANGGTAVLHPDGLALLTGPGRPPMPAVAGDWLVLVGVTFAALPDRAYRELFRDEP